MAKAAAKKAAPKKAAAKKQQLQKKQQQKRNKHRLFLRIYKTSFGRFFHFVGNRT